jgi:hypothetical protein
MAALGAVKAKKDTYSNVAFQAMAMSAANTLTFAQITLAVGLFQGIAMLLSRVKWQPSEATCREMVANSDLLVMALTSSNRLTTLTAMNDPAMLAYEEIVGIGASVEPWRLPIITDFSTLPGGGKLIAANPIFLAAMTGGFVAAATIRCQLDFTFLTLSDQDYLELIQAQFPANVT